MSSHCLLDFSFANSQCVVMPISQKMAGSAGMRPGGCLTGGAGGAPPADDPGGGLDIGEMHMSSAVFACPLPHFLASCLLTLKFLDNFSCRLTKQSSFGSKVFPCWLSCAHDLICYLVSANYFLTFCCVSSCVVCTSLFCRCANAAFLLN